MFCSETEATNEGGTASSWESGEESEPQATTHWFCDLEPVANLSSASLPMKWGPELVLPTYTHKKELELRLGVESQAYDTNTQDSPSPARTT